MIQVYRGSTLEPPKLRLGGAESAHRRAAKFFASRSKSETQRQHDFDFDVLQTSDVRKALRDVFGERCAFCGRGRERTGQLEVHHFRPPEGAVGEDGKISRHHYWWLAYRWENLYFACSECRIAQGQKFPVRGPRARAMAGGRALADEDALLLDPAAEDPEPFLVYLNSGEVVSGDVKGKTTIETFELNRHRLVRQRALEVEEVSWEISRLNGAMREENVDLLLELLHDLYDWGRPLAALRRQQANQWVQFRPRKLESMLQRAAGSAEVLKELVGSLRRVTNAVKEHEAWAYYGDAAQFVLHPDSLVRGREIQIRDEEMPSPSEFRRVAPRVERSQPWTYFDAAEIRSVEIRNFRAIEHIRLEATEGPGEGSWLMLLGENGTGKSSILQAIALALSDEKTVGAYSKEAQHVLRKGAEWGQIRVELTGRHKFRELRFGGEYRGFEASRPMEGVLVAGYGASRLLPRSGRPRRAKSKIDSLFDPFVPLSRPSSWLTRLDDDRFDAVARSLKRLLDLAEEETMRLVDGDIYFVKGRRRLRLADLSDGYQAVAGFALDLMELFLSRWGSLEAAEGVVLVDELGAHLHPRWQMKVTEQFRDAFPRIQFIATTHDPLCLQGLKDGEVALLRRNKDDEVYALHRELPSVEGLAVDQILTSEHFGLHTTRDPAVERLLTAYYTLLADRRRGAREGERLEQVRRELDSYNLLGTTRRERLALRAADEFIAEQPRLESGAEYLNLRDATLQRIREIWESRLR